MKVSNPRYSLNTSVLRCVIAIIAGTATLASGVSSVLAQEFEEASVPGSPITHDTSTTSVQLLSVTSGKMPGKSGSSDIADILNDNPYLLVPLSSTHSIDDIDDDVADVTGMENAGGSELDLRGTGYEQNLTLVDSLIDSI